MVFHPLLGFFVVVCCCIYLHILDLFELQFWIPLEKLKVKHCYPDSPDSPRVKTSPMVHAMNTWMKQVWMLLPVEVRRTSGRAPVWGTGDAARTFKPFSGAGLKRLWTRGEETLPRFNCFRNGLQAKDSAQIYLPFTFLFPLVHKLILFLSQTSESPVMGAYNNNNNPARRGTGKGTWGFQANKIK